MEAPTPDRALTCIIWQFSLAENYMKLKKKQTIGSRRGRASLTPPLESATVDVKNIKVVFTL